MKIKTARFAISCASLEECPKAELPEFAFIGRSNVGKSSLINMLVNQKALARVSQRPGLTRLINFFVVNEDWCLVDLPGYGYAKAAKSERNRFNDFVAAYLEHREGLQHVFVLIDSRLPPQAIDLELVNWLVEVQQPFSLVFTKTDKVKKGKLAANQSLFIEALHEFLEGDPPIFATSAKDNDGRQQLLGGIGALLAECRA